MRRPQRACLFPGCGRLVDSGYCEAHKRKDMSDQWRGSARERGYDTIWGKFRMQYLRRFPLCDCGKLAVIVHHKQLLAEGGEKYEEKNLQSVCQACHNKIHFGIKIRGEKNDN